MFTSSIILDKNVPSQMRDGTILYADVYRPNQKGRFPVLLTRLPYNKDDPYYSHRYIDTNRLVQNGYVVIIQDVRGRYASEGDFYPFIHEAQDGYDTIEWAASLPYSSGKVGMFDLSYYGFTQLLAAMEKPPHLHAIFPVMTPNDIYHNMLMHDGARKIASFKTWVLESIIPDLLKRTYKDPIVYQEKLKAWVEALDYLESTYNQDPSSWDVLRNLQVAHFYHDFISEKPKDKVTTLKITHRYEDINVPAFHIAGWYDNFLQPTIENFIEMSKSSTYPQKLIIGPWTHGNFSEVTGELNFGIEVSEQCLRGREDLTQLHLRWFDYWLKNQRTGIEDEAPISIFVMGINEWRDVYEWPLNHTEYTPYYFHSKGDANFLDGNGKLSLEKPGNQPPDTYIHHPERPVPTNGGQTLYRGINTSGPRNQSRFDNRQDILTFTTDELSEPIEVTGSIQVVLWARTDVNDIDYTAKLVDVHPDGSAYNLTDGIVRASYHQNKTNIRGDIHCYTIDLWSTSNVFLPGHRIRVEIASSNFPHFDVNQQTKSSNQHTKQSARQTIFHDTMYPSHILLPIIQ